MPQGHVQVVLGGQTMPECLEAALRRVGATVSFGPISEVRRLGLKSTADAVVVVPSEDARSGSDGLQELFTQVANHPRATLVLQPEGSDAPRPAHPAALPVSFSTQTSAEELAARIATMIEMRDSLESLHRISAAARHADERLALQYRQQMHVASQLQREFLPHALPRCRGISFSAIYRPMDYVSGDIYDVRRLDDEHVAIALVDAQGHGICAALLTVFIKRALREEMGRNGDYRPLRPDEMLSRLNKELLEAELTESPFAAAIYALLNVRTRRVELARGGAPYPIRRYANGSSRLLRPAGPLVGVLSNARFEVESFELGPGESLMIYSDGVDQIVRSTPPLCTCPTAFGQSRYGARGDRLVTSSQTRAAPRRTLATSQPAAERGTEVITARCLAPTSKGTCSPADRRSDAEASKVAPDEIIATTPWYKQLRDEGVAAALQQLERRHATLRRLGHAVDDMTVLAIHVER